MCYMNRFLNTVSRCEIICINQIFADQSACQLWSLQRRVPISHLLIWPCLNARLAYCLPTQRGPYSGHCEISRIPVNSSITFVKARLEAGSKNPVLNRSITWMHADKMFIQMDFYPFLPKTSKCYSSYFPFYQNSQEHPNDQSNFLLDYKDWFQGKVGCLENNSSKIFI